MQDDTEYKELEEVAKEMGYEIFKISAATKSGLNELIAHVAEVVKTLPKEEVVEKDERVMYTLEDERPEFEIEIVNGEYVVTGPAIERIMGRINPDDNESLSYFQKTLKKLGVDNALKEKGIKDGDSVKFIDWEFEWYD